MVIVMEVEGDSGDCGEGEEQWWEVAVVIVVRLRL